MDKIAGIAESERSELFQATADQLDMVPAAVEKDFWVCWVLKKIYEHPDLSQQLLFKGGTSLSKCYGLIDRFSEDIDLIMDWTLLTDKDPYEERSNTQQDKFNKAMEVAAQKYATGPLLDQLQKLLGTTGELLPDPDTDRAILFRYPRAFDAYYIRPNILIEVSPMSAMTPSRDMVVYSHAAEEFPNLFEDSEVPIRVIEARKTFWDKITILHVEAHRPETKATPDRYSRHYYDTYQMLNSDVKAEAMVDLELLQQVSVFKNKFYPQGWANYQAAIEGNFTLVPQAHTMDALRRDYASMEEMIHGDYPDFDLIMETIALFETDLNEATAI